MQITVQKACELLVAQDNILIIAHSKPDGDTLGSSFALLRALQSLGKTAGVACCDGFPDRYRFLCGDYITPEFSPNFVVAVDVAGPKLLGGLEKQYAHRVNLCIDHHVSNEFYAEHTLLDAQAAAAAQVIYKVILGLGVTPNREIADAVFTGLTTDTGCFKYSSVTSETHRIAAEMIDRGADHSGINKLMFQTKSRGRIEVDRLMMESIAFHFDNQCVLIKLPAGLCETYGVTEEDLDGISAFPTTIEGVLAGVTVRDRGDGVYRVSLRTHSPVDASRICKAFGGGGHMNAAGCTLTGSWEELCPKLMNVVEQELKSAL